MLVSCLKRTQLAFGCLFLWLVNVAVADTVLSLGDSLTSGFPSGDSTGYQSELPAGTTFIGDATSDTGDLYVGGDGHYISQTPKVDGPIVSAIFQADGILGKFQTWEATASASDVPDYVVVLGGINDLRLLVSPGGLNTFTPDPATPNDYTAAGTFTHDNGGNPVQFEVDPLIDRYDVLLDAVAARFPATLEILCVALTPIDEANIDFSAAEAALLATAVSNFNVQLSNLASSKGPRFSFIDPGLVVTEVESTSDILFTDGLHPSALGYGKIGTAVENFMTLANDPPVISPVILNEEEDEGTLIDFTAAATDPDGGQVVSYSLSGDVPDGAVIDSVTGEFEWTPTEPQGAGVYEIVVIASDDGPGTLNDGQIVIVTVREVNLPPTLSGVPDQSAVEGQLLSFLVDQGEDDDLPAQTLSYSLSGAPTGASITPGGEFAWTPGETDGGQSFTFDIIVKDPDNTSDSDEITIMVSEANEDPTLTPIDSVEADEETEIAFTVTAADTDVPSTLTFSLEGVGGEAVPDGAVIDPVTGEFSWTPTEEQGFEGPPSWKTSYMIDVVVKDNAGGEARQTVQFTINEANKAPSFPTIGTVPATEGVELVIDLSAMVEDPDVPQNLFEYRMFDQHADATLVDGVFRWTPIGLLADQDFTVNLVVKDNGPGGGLEYGEEITISVQNVNIAPELTPIADRTLGRLSTLSFTATGNDPDGPNNALMFSLRDEPVGAFIDAAGRFRWSLSDSQGVGAYSFKVVVSDGDLEAEQEVAITVVEPEIRIMTLGDSITQGLPHEDGISYHNFLDDNLSMPATYEGNLETADTPLADSGARIVGRDGSVISQIPPQVFSPPGVREHFEAVKDSVVDPNFVVVMVGTNDLMQLISPVNVDYEFVPESGGNFASAGTFQPKQGISGDSFDVLPMIERYEDLLMDIATAFPPSTKILTVAISPADANTENLFGQPGGQFDLAKEDLVAMVPVLNGQIQTLAGTLGDRFAFLDPALNVTQLLDGLHPTLDGYEQIGVTIANFINGNEEPVLEVIATEAFEVAEESLLDFDAEAMDASGHGLTYSLFGAPAGATINPSTGEFTWTPTALQGPASYTFHVVARDDGPGKFADSEEVVVNVTGPGDLYDDWIAIHFSAADRNDPSKEATVWGRQANPDGGEWANEFEFYLGTDPNVVDEPDFEIVDTPTGAIAVYSKDEDIPLGAIEIQWSIDMENWSSVGITRQVTGAASGGLEPVEAEVTSGSERIFFKFVGQPQT